MTSQDKRTVRDSALVLRRIAATAMKRGVGHRLVATLMRAASEAERAWELIEEQDEKR